jgi:hypothetical protein
MARFEMIAGWPGGVLYTATHGRLYCAAPRGLVPDHPYTMAALRPPSAQEQRAWGVGVQPRMVVDVTGMTDLHPSLRAGKLCVAPWNAYLVLRLPEGQVVVAYKLGTALPRLDRDAATQVAIAGGHDVAGWPAEVTRRYQSEHWYFLPPRPHPIPTPSGRLISAQL